MVKTGQRIPLAGLILAMFSAVVLAADFTGWEIGDTADRDITAPLTLDVIDTRATAARRAEVAVKISPVFRSYTSVTNTMVVKLAAAFSETRSNFLAAVQNTFQQAQLDAAKVQTSAFEDFVGTFNERNKKLPVTLAIARQWAQGQSSGQFEADLAKRMLLSVRRPVTPDTLPASYQPGKSVRLVTVRVAKEPLTLQQAERRGKVIAQTNLIAVTQLRSQFRREFSRDEQDFARALSNFIHPNCDLDTNLTAEARELAVGQVTVAYHYDAGQVIVHRGQKVDSRIQATLQRLAETTAAAAPRPAEPLPVAPAPVMKVVHRDWQWLWWTATGVLILAAGTFIWSRKRRPQPDGQLVRLQPGAPAALPAEMAPQLVQILKTAVVQELAAQRQELMQAQHTAAAEVVRLMQRLNELQAPLQDRLAAYERRIQELETELTVRKEENRELLTMKIDLLRQQLEAERVVGRQTGFN